MEQWWKYAILVEDGQIDKLILAKQKRCFPSGQNHEMEYKNDVPGKKNIIAETQMSKLYLASNKLFKDFKQRSNKSDL